MKFKKVSGLVALLVSFLMGCGPNMRLLKGGIYVKYSDDKFEYVYLPINYNEKFSGYYVMGKNKGRGYAELNAEGNLELINDYCKPTLRDLREVDKLGDVKWIIEGEELKELINIRMYKNITDLIDK